MSASSENLTGIVPDFKLVAADGQEFLCHRAILADRIDFFKSVFRHGFHESHIGSMKFSNASANALELFVRFIYAQTLTAPAPSALVVAELLELSRCYEFPTLFSCVMETFLTDDIVSEGCQIILKRWDTDSVVFDKVVTSLASLLSSRHASSGVFRNFACLGGDTLRNLLNHPSFKPHCTGNSIYEFLVLWRKQAGAAGQRVFWDLCDTHLRQRPLGTAVSLQHGRQFPPPQLDQSMDGRATHFSCTDHQGRAAHFLISQRYQLDNGMGDAQCDFNIGADEGAFIWILFGDLVTKSLKVHPDPEDARFLIRWVVRILGSDNFAESPRWIEISGQTNFDLSNLLTGLALPCEAELELGVVILE